MKTIRPDRAHQQNEDDWESLLATAPVTRSTQEKTQQYRRRSGTTRPKVVASKTDADRAVLEYHLQSMAARFRSAADVPDDQDDVN